MRACVCVNVLMACHAPLLQGHALHGRAPLHVDGQRSCSAALSRSAFPARVRPPALIVGGRRQPLRATRRLSQRFGDGLCQHRVGLDAADQEHGQRVRGATRGPSVALTCVQAGCLVHGALQRDGGGLWHVVR